MRTLYQTLYRKYRPKDFDDMVGQEVIVRTLKNTIKNDKLGHAYLFTGPRGTGKTSVAKILAKTINCDHPKDGIPCNECPNCIQFNQKQTTDIIEIDAASNNGVDEIRELRSKVNLVPTGGKYKIYIIDEVHMLTVGAFNALLKTLEEPPAHILFVLATTEPHKIPATILSRCQRFDFKKISVDSIVERLDYVTTAENIEIDASAKEEIARLADGGMRDALSILDQVIAYADHSITRKDIHEINGTITPEELKVLIEGMLNQNMEQVFGLIDEYDHKGKNFIKLTEEVIQFLRNILLAIHVPNYLKTHVMNYELYEQIVFDFDPSKIVTWIETFNHATTAMKVSNSPRILFELTMIQLMEVSNQPPIKMEEKEHAGPSSTKKEASNNSSIPIFPNSSKESKLVLENKGPIPNDFIIKLEKIRVNNTLCNFNRKRFLDAKNSIEELKTLLLDPTYADLASLVLDGELKAASEDHFIFIYDRESFVEQFNSQCQAIDQMLKQFYQLPIKSIATTSESWNRIKQEFNSKQKQYTYMEEPEFELESFQEEQNEIDAAFAELVQYE